MAWMYASDCKDPVDVQPENGRVFSVGELRNLVGNERAGFMPKDFEIRRTPRGDPVVVAATHCTHGLPVNRQASKELGIAVCGPALLCHESELG